MSERTLELPALTDVTPVQPGINWNILWTLVRREVRDSLRDWRIVIPIGLLTLLFPLVMNVMADVVFDFLERYDATIIGERFIPFGLLAVGFFPMSFSLVIALESFVGERERNSLEALLATPAGDVELYLGKLLASLLLPLVASYVGIAIYGISVVWGRLWNLPATLFLQILALTTVEGLVMVTAAVIVSSHTTSVRAANLLASFIIVPMAFLVQIESLIIFWGREEALWWIMAGLLVLDVALVRAGIRTFNREAILAREIDFLNIERAVRLFWYFLKAPPEAAPRVRQQSGEAVPRFQLARVYRHDVPRLLAANRWGVATACVTTAMGFLLGWGLIRWWNLPIDFFNLNTFDARAFRATLMQGIPGSATTLLPPFAIGAIFVHNLRVLVGGAFLSLFSFGVVALLLLLAPMTIVGFLAGALAAQGQNWLQFLAAFILPHGSLEIPAVLLSTAFAVRLGAIMLAPPQDFSAGEALLLATADYVKVLLFVVIPLLLIAALVEVYVTPLVVVWLYT
ncbi:MAG: stage II sporulation protein M [Ardenticatenia bacterium]|nr:stage II sporulation protein M [Ardenticatenia bacterium]